MPSRGFVALLCAACRTLVDTSASIQHVCLLFRVPPGQLLIVYSTAQPCWASLSREQSIAVLHVVWFCTCPLSSTGAELLLGLVLLLIHLHGCELTSVPVLPAVAAVPHPRGSLRVVQLVLVPGSAGGRPWGSSGPYP